MPPVMSERPPVAEEVEHVEIRHGDFLFDMPLPHGIDVERVEARYERGYLEVVLPHAGGDA